MTFDILKHTLPEDKALIQKILLPAAKEFMNSPAHSLKDVPVFFGVGVYALFISEDIKTLYSERISKEYPVYIGKAVPSGSRQGRSNSSKSQLRKRLSEHRRSIKQGGLPVEAFKCRFMVLNGINQDLISSLETTLIRMFHPIWNSYIDGFGIHPPGSGRYNQQPSEWDTLHPGRPWLSKLTGQRRDKAQILSKIDNYCMRSFDEIG